MEELECFGGVLEASWRRLGGVLSNLGGVLGRVEVSRAVFQVSWDALETFVDRLGSSLEVS